MPAENPSSLRGVCERNGDREVERADAGVKIQAAANDDARLQRDCLTRWAVLSFVWSRLVVLVLIVESYHFTICTMFTLAKWYSMRESVPNNNIFTKYWYDYYKQMLQKDVTRDPIASVPAWLLVPAKHLCSEMSSVQGEPLSNQGDGVKAWDKEDLEPEYFDCSAHEENAEDPGASRSTANTPKNEQGGFFQTLQDEAGDTDAPSPVQRFRDYDWTEGVGRVIGDNPRSSGGTKPGIKTVFEDEPSNDGRHIYPEFDPKNVPKTQVNIDRSKPIISDASTAGTTAPMGRRMSENSNAPPNAVVHGASQSERVMAEGPELHQVAEQALDLDHPEEILFTEVHPTEIAAPEENTVAVDTAEAAVTAVAGGEKEGLTAALNQGALVARDEIEHETGAGEAVELEPEPEVEGSAPHAGQPEPQTTEMLQSEMPAPSVDGSEKEMTVEGSVGDFLTQGYTLQAEPQSRDDIPNLEVAEQKDIYKDSGLRLPRTRGEINLTPRKDVVASGSDEAEGRVVSEGQEVETAASSSPALESKTMDKNMLEPPENTISQVLALSSPYVGGQRKDLQDGRKELSESEVIVPKPSTALESPEANANVHETEQDKSAKEDAADSADEAMGNDSADHATGEAPALVYDPTVKMEEEQPQDEEADEEADEAARGLAARAASPPANDDLPAPRGSEFLDGMADDGGGSSEMDARLRQIQAEVVEASAASAEEEKRRSFQRIFAEYACLSPPPSTPSDMNAALAAPTASNERNMSWEKSQRPIVEQAPTSFNNGDSAWRYDNSTVDTTSDSIRSRMMAESNTGTPPHRTKSINTATQTPAETATQTEDYKDRSFLDDMAEWAGGCAKRDGRKDERGDVLLGTEERQWNKVDVSARSSEPTSSLNSPQLNEVRRTEGASKRQSPKTQFYTF